MPDLAERLNALFSRVPRPDGRTHYSNADVAQALSENEVSVTGVYLSQLRSGRRDNPSARLLAALAKFFGVPIAYFFDEEEAQAITDQLDALAAVRDSRIEGIMNRATGMTDQGINHLAGIIDHIVALEREQNENDSSGRNSDEPGQP